MSAKHTPGPWTQHEGEVWAKNYGLISRSYYGKPDGEGDSNARLIAAAPDLLEALKELLDRELQDDEGDYTLEMARRKASAAITKAIG